MIEVIYFKYDNGYEVWRDFDEENNCIHWKDFSGVEHWWEHRVETSVMCIKITKEEFEEIEAKKKGKKNIYTRFEIMDM